jgi:hypothetical protein
LKPFAINAVTDVTGQVAVWAAFGTGLLLALVAVGYVAFELLLGTAAGGLCGLVGKAPGAIRPL